MHTIEWQKRGGTHMHMLLWLEKKIRANEIDMVISAEIPPTDSPLYPIVISKMIHGPCGDYNLDSPCMVNGKCSKNFPKSFISETDSEGNGYPLYRRRSPQDGGGSYQIRLKQKDVTVHNGYVVPYCPALLRAFDAHVNVEICNSITAIKYICKYVNKGCDQATISLNTNTVRDEISDYQSGRYISTSEAVFRI